MPKRKKTPGGECRTLEDVIMALGGDNGVKQLTGAKQNNLGNWRNEQGKFPAHTFLIMRRALALKGYTAPAELWGIREP